MTEATLLILVHQLLFQGMFFAKNCMLRRKLGKPIRGFNPEANLSIAFFALFIALSLYLASYPASPGRLELMPDRAAMIASLLVLLINLLLALASLRHIGDSWRVGVIEEQQTQLVQNGIYRFTRNPYFAAYLLMFVAYTLLLQNTILLVLSLVGCGLVHTMILREEKYLARTHGAEYQRYKRRVPRYFIV